MINKIKKIGKELKGFSLVELMVTLIAIAVITAAFTPTLSQKIKESSVAVVGLSTKCERLMTEKRKNFTPPDNCPAEYPDCKGECTLCDKKNCAWCGLPRNMLYFRVNEEACVYEACPDNCEICPELDSCQKCEPGYEKVSIGNNKYKCVPCPKGTIDEGKLTQRDYSSQSPGNNIKCDKCENGSYPNTQQTACGSCKNGYVCKIETYNGRKVSTQGQCPLGERPNHEQTACEKCPAGTKGVTKNGINTCEKCPCGTYQDTPGETECIECPKDNACSVGASNATGCPAGYGSYLGGKNNKDKCKCEPCEDNNASECDTPKNSTICKSKDFILTGNEGEKKCMCPSDMEQIAGKYECKCKDADKIKINGSCDCKDPFIKLNNGSCGCRDTFIRDGNSCVCPSDKYLDTNENKCKSCPDTFELKNGTCVCPSDKYLNTNTNKCEYCPDGYELKDGKCELIGCPAGQYMDNGTCKNCPKGHKCPGGQSPKEQCPAIEYQDQEGQSTCKSCTDVCKNNETPCDDNAIWEYPNGHGGQSVIKAWRSTSTGGVSCVMFCPLGFYHSLDEEEQNVKYNCNKDCCLASQWNSGNRPGQTCGPGGTRIYVSRNQNKDPNKYHMNGKRLVGECYGRGSKCVEGEAYGEKGWVCELMYGGNMRPSNTSGYIFPEEDPPAN